ncbi:unnamed protein product [Schistocephalus solidus]|uniref:Uncharacterized protein n=1 Tax=Schistocephalus solidus TaxID=70667 RepID=A0A0X3PVC0_SCHSO|nr:unnamed protein product [Schistocephalus solidus]
MSYSRKGFVNTIDGYLDKLLWATPPIQRVYLVAALANAFLGIFECLIIMRTRFASTNTVLCYLTSALVALSQVMMEIHNNFPNPSFAEVFSLIFIMNVFYLVICLVFSSKRHSALIAVVFLSIFCTMMYAIHAGLYIVPNKQAFLHVMQFATAVANNFIPFDPLLASLSDNHRNFPSQWFPLLTGLVYCLSGGLYRHARKDSLMAPADALGIAVHLFGITIELQHCLFH